MTNQQTAGSAVAHERVEAAVDQKERRKKKTEKRRERTKRVFRDAALLSIQRIGIFHFSGMNSVPFALVGRRRAPYKVLDPPFFSE